MITQLLAILFIITYNVTFILAHYNEDYDESSKNASTSLHYEFVLLDEKHPCARTCIQGAPPMICRYNFKMENYYTMTKACHNCPFNREDCFRADCIVGDGHERGVVSVNRRIPGPSVEVCQNDLIIVDLENHLMSEGTTIHWHGQHQRGTPYMDGVPYVTQCPILPRTTFRYNFRATQAGTHFWHSHLGMQRVDGGYGPLIVRVPEEENPLDSLYDYDLSSHIMTLIDWERVTGMEKFLYHHHSVGNNKPATLLINGLGRYKEFYDTENRTYYTPLARFTVEQGYRYRFRVINAGFLNCPIEMSVDNHTIKVISTDGSDVAPVEAESLVTYAGERFDFILSADQPKKLYWIRFRGLMDCDERFTKAHQVAVLEYESFNFENNSQATNVDDHQNYQTLGTTINDLIPDDSELDFNVTFVLLDENENSTTESDQHQVNITEETTEDYQQVYVINDVNGELLPEGNPNYENSRRMGKQINSLNKGTEANNSHVSMPELSSLQKWDDSLRLKPDYQIFLAYDFYNLDNKHFHGQGYEFYNVTSVDNRLLTPQINHISMKMPSFPLLPQRSEIPSSMFCNENTIKGMDCVNSYCECPHAYQIPLNSVVELILIDEGFAYDANHPLHLHGYAFRVVAMERVGRNITVEQVKQREKDGLIKRNLVNPPIKDTVTVPDGGYTVVRFFASNPGYWIFHCHIEFHAEIGMALVFKIGEDNQMPPVPRDFPKCGSYLPEETEDNEIKPNCSRSTLVNKFEKVLFGDYCKDVPSSSKRTQNSPFVICVCLIFAIFKVRLHKYLI